jgi:hypothetical protein
MSSRYTWSLAILLLFAIVTNAPAHAFAHYVASYGTDSAACTRTAPCFTLQTAHNNASASDTIVCLDTIVNGAPLFIGKSIDIECSGARAVLRDSGPFVPGIIINAPLSSTDVFRAVRLRGISINGAGATSNHMNRGIDITSAAVVYIEDCVVSDVGQQGILDQRTGGQTRLYINDTFVRNNVGAGVVAAAGATGISVLDNVRLENNGYGLAAATGNSVVINRSVLSGNSTAGVEGDAGSQIVVNNSTISHNGTGVQSSSSVRLSNNDIAFNITAVTGTSGTFGNNRFSGNGSPGTPPTPLGGASGEFAQQ